LGNGQTKVEQAGRAEVNTIGVGRVGQSWAELGKLGQSWASTSNVAQARATLGKHEKRCDCVAYTTLLLVEVF
jgi:hypothetical protein